MLLYIFHAPIYLRNGSGKSALEVASNGNTRSIIETYLKEEHDRIQDDYKEIQDLSSKKYSGAQRLTRVFVLGYKQSGKSTLIESLKRQNFFSSFKRVSEAIVPPHTSGIIPSEYRYKSTGRVLYYDFAGDPEYYSSHSAIMSSVVQSSQGTNVFLVLVNFQKDSKHVFEELGYWFGFISYHCAKLKENSCKVLTIGSHVDLVTKQEARRKAALVSEFTRKYLSLSSKVPAIEIVKGKTELIINCCNPRSSTCVHHTLNQIVKRASTYRLSVEAAILLGLFEKDFKDVVTCRIQTLLTHIMETGIHLPNAAESIYPKIMELHNIGLIMIIESKSHKLEDYLLLLNISKLTNEVHKLLFSKDSSQTFPLSTDPYSASMGILPQTYLSSILPEYITIECLIELQYCQEFSHAEIKSDETYSVTPSKDPDAETLLLNYFPSLCETERRESLNRIPEGYKCIGWYLKCGRTFDYLPPRFLHVLLLRLAHAFALPAACDHSSMEDDVLATVRLYNRRCTMWKNGIHWLMEEGGVECFVEMINKSKGIIVITKSEAAQITTCTEMLFEIIRKIHQAKEEFCETISLQEYYLHVDDFIDENKLDSDDPITSTGDSLFLSSDIARVLKDSELKDSTPKFMISAKGDASLKATEVSYLQNYIHWGMC
jgi:GTPase SAR1 family protein